MSHPILEQKRTDACLSSWQIAQISLDLMASEAVQEAKLHLGSCDTCATNLRLQQEGIQAAKYEAIPENVKAAATRPKPWIDFSKLFVMAGAVAMTLALLVVVRYSSEPRLEDPSVRIKGTPGVEVMVKRDNQIIFEGVALEHLSGKWQPGDALRLRIRGAKDAYMALEGKQQGKWQRFFEGRVPRDEWLPVGVTLTAGKESVLRVVICENKSMLRKSPHKCRMSTYVLGASP